MKKEYNFHNKFEDRESARKVDTKKASDELEIYTAWVNFWKQHNLDQLDLAAGSPMNMPPDWWDAELLESTPEETAASIFEGSSASPEVINKLVMLIKKYATNSAAVAHDSVDEFEDEDYVDEGEGLSAAMNAAIAFADDHGISEDEIDWLQDTASNIWADGTLSDEEFGDYDAVYAHVYGEFERRLESGEWAIDEDGAVDISGDVKATDAATDWHDSEIIEPFTDGDEISLLDFLANEIVPELENGDEVMSEFNTIEDLEDKKRFVSYIWNKHFDGEVVLEDVIEDDLPLDEAEELELPYEDEIIE